MLPKFRQNIIPTFPFYAVIKSMNRMLPFRFACLPFVISKFTQNYETYTRKYIFLQSRIFQALGQVVRTFTTGK
jgi:hypothetical protein